MPIKKILLPVAAIVFSFPALSQDPTLEEVTTTGNTTSKSIIIKNADGLVVAVDPAYNFNVTTHKIKASPEESRTLRFDCSSITPSGGWEFYNSGSSSSLLYVKQNGNVGIGTASPQSTLAVNGAITSKKVTVELEGWPDFVFHPAYTFPTLHELELFIKKNRHLPGIPPGKEVAAQGIDLGEMQAKLLQKVEEMTLYLIELNKQLEKQQDIIEQQQAQLEEQAKLLEQLSNN